MLSKKATNWSAIIILILPAIIYYHLHNYRTGVVVNADLHFYYVLFSAMIAFFVGFSAFLEYKKSKVEKIFLVSVGFIGLGILYAFHALITPEVTLLQNAGLSFPVRNISVFVLIGDLSRLWLALMLFIPDNFFDNKQHIKKYFNGYTLTVLSVLIFILGYAIISTPEMIPAFKNENLTDTYFAILIKVFTLILLGINALKYYYSYKVKSNFTILTFIIGLLLIMETIIIFMVSTPWDSTWWLAHNLFLVSYIIMGGGIVYSYIGREKYEYFDILGQIKTYTNLLEEKNRQLNKLVNHDFLTGLTNRRYFMAETEEYIRKAAKEERTFALLFIDLDYFKSVNDRYGHQIGDELLQVVSDKITDLISPDDMASRIGGDEFVLLLKNVNRTQMSDVAKRILEALAEPISIKGNAFKIGVSIGISVYPADGHTIDELISKSDEAMYKVKREGRNHYKIASDEKSNAAALFDGKSLEATQTDG